MKRTSVLLTAALLAGGAGAVISSSGSAQAPTLRTLTFTERDAREFATRFSESRLSPDDSFVFTASLRDSAGQPAGRESGACSAISRNATECQATLFLKAGKIFVSGGTVFGARTVLGVVGGTGAYIGARGTLTVVDRKSGDQLTVTLLA